MDAKAKVFFAFNSDGEATDLDPVASLSKREISVTYLARRVVLEPFAQKIKKQSSLMVLVGCS